MLALRNSRLPFLRRNTRTVALFSLGVMSLLPAARAQTPSPAVATINTDTGALAPGHRDFSRYTTPALCAAAVQSERQAALRTLAAQAAEVTARRAPASDTLPSSAIMVAKMCGARFPSRTAPVRDLPVLFSLALAANDDSLATAMLTRWLTTAQTDSQHTRILMAALNGYLTATPARIGAARALVAGAVGTNPTGTSPSAPNPSAGRARLWLELHLALLTFWASERPDAPERAEEADSMLHFVRTGQAAGLSGVEQQLVVSKCYTALMSVASLRHIRAPDSVLMALAQRAKTDLDAISPDTVWYSATPKGNLPRGSRIAPAGRSAAAMRAAGYVMQTEQIEKRDATVAKIARDLAPAGVMLGDSARRSQPLHAQLWLPTGAGTVRVSPGTLELRYRLTKGCVTSYSEPLWTEGCSAPLAQLQQWQHTYGSRLRLTVVTPLYGHALYAGPQTPAEEAQTVAWYVRDFWHLPATVALLPRASETMQRQEQRQLPPPALEVIDDAGHVLYRGAMLESRSDDNTPFLSALFAHVFASEPHTP